MSVVKNLDVQQSGAIRADTYTDSLSLAAGVAEAFTVPTFAGSTKARYVILCATSDIYVNWTTTATVPSDVTDGTASELNPSGLYYLDSITSISVISESSCRVIAKFYS